MSKSSLLIGMHFSGPRLQAALINDAGQVLERREATISPKTMIQQVASIARELGSQGGDVSALGFGIPGLVNRQTDVVIVSPDLPTGIRENLHKELTEATGLRVELENDANAAAYGEFKVGAGVGSHNIFYMPGGLPDGSNCLWRCERSE